MFIKVVLLSLSFSVCMNVCMCLCVFHVPHFMQYAWLHMKMRKETPDLQSERSPASLAVRGFSLFVSRDSCTPADHEGIHECEIKSIKEQFCGNPAEDG